MIALNGIINIIDYRGNSNKNGNPIGHPIKVINEFAGLLKNNFTVSLSIPKNHMGHIEDESFYEIQWLDHYLNIYAIGFERFKNFVFRYSNLCKIFRNNRNNKNDIFWFINADIILIIFIMLNPQTLRNNKKWLTLYNDFGYENSAIRRILIRKYIKSFDVIFTSNIQLNCNNPLTIFFPDYIYNPEFYNKYKHTTKKDQVLFIGTINQDKDIDKLVSAFASTNLKLLIAGEFEDSSHFERLCVEASENIQFINAYVPPDLYYNLIGESKFVILPYKDGAYKNRSSGVAFEALYLDSIVIAPEYLINFKMMNGIKFQRIIEVPQIINSINESEIQDILRYNSEIRMSYSHEEIIKTLTQISIF